MVGFAAETEHVIDHAKAKLAKKGCDLIVANDVVAREWRIRWRPQQRSSGQSKAGVENWPELVQGGSGYTRLMHDLAGIAVTHD